MTVTSMRKIIAILLLASSLAACGMIGTLVDGFKHARAVASDLEQATGVKPEVGFNWHNGRLVRVSVGFPKMYDAKPLRELADLVRSSVRKQFEQTPEDIELAFSIGATARDTSAQAGQPRQHASLTR
jgi:predicted small lipoprotein YifL